MVVTTRKKKAKYHADSLAVDVEKKVEKDVAGTGERFHTSKDSNLPVCFGNTTAKEDRERSKIARVDDEHRDDGDDFEHRQSYNVTVKDNTVKHDELKLTIVEQNVKKPIKQNEACALILTAIPSTIVKSYNRETTHVELDWKECTCSVMTSLDVYAAKLTLLHSRASALCSSFCLKQLLHLLLLNMFGANFLHSAPVPRTPAVPPDIATQEISNITIIKEVCDDENAHETFEYERALESECSLIMIEPSKLGNETSRWIVVGNCLRKTAALSGLAAITTEEISNVAIIKEVYDNENAHETFEYELERALESECSLIIIEPSKLGDETSRWIAVGNCLHKTAALSGLAAITTGLIWGDQPYICGPLGFISAISCGLYTVSWQFDPCCQYQVETNTSKLPHVELLAVLGPSSPTFLVRKDDTRRRILHTTITLIALGISTWRVYQAFK
ncbi:hypothetical protein WN51_03946 [Melipona quadrifasciata]|uniref:Transmembrane protein 11 n=1 Tax=Melipona quadrifasciata TaxID=166423 RepID=A0A0M8ZPH4_9HYME|nr:hypothetical protein WN51_03946 [Melipona quadrifasciata]